MFIGIFPSFFAVKILPPSPDGLTPPRAYLMSTAAKQLTIDVGKAVPLGYDKEKSMAGIGATVARVLGLGEVCATTIGADSVRIRAAKIKNFRCKISTFRKLSKRK